MSCQSKQELLRYFIWTKVVERPAMMKTCQISTFMNSFLSVLMRPGCEVIKLPSDTLNTPPRWRVIVVFLQALPPLNCHTLKYKHGPNCVSVKSSSDCCCRTAEQLLDSAKLPKTTTKQQRRAVCSSPLDEREHVIPEWKGSIFFSSCCLRAETMLYSNINRTYGSSAMWNVLPTDTSEQIVFVYRFMLIHQRNYNQDDGWCVETNFTFWIAIAEKEPFYHFQGLMWVISMQNEVHFIFAHREQINFRHQHRGVMLHFQSSNCICGCFQSAIGRERL